MQVVPRGAAGVADVGDHLPGLHLLALGDADLTAMGIERLQAAAVVDLDVVPVAAAPAVKGVGHCDRSVRVGKNWRTLRHSNISTVVVAGFAGQRVGAVAERRGADHRAVPRPGIRPAGRSGAAESGHGRGLRHSAHQGRW